MSSTPFIRLVTCLVLVALLVGCSSVGEMEQAARDATQQLIELETEIATKTKAENDYYSTTIANVRSDFRRDRSVDLTRHITSSARTFVRKNQGAAALSLDAKLEKYVVDTVKVWKKRESDRSKELAELTSSLEEGRKALEVEEAKIKSLKDKLRALGSSKSTKELVRFLVGFSREVKASYDKLREESEGS